MICWGVQAAWDAWEPVALYGGARDIRIRMDIKNDQLESGGFQKDFQLPNWQLSDRFAP
jgi:hypothetical protein